MSIASAAGPYYTPPSTFSSVVAAPSAASYTTSYTMQGLAALIIPGTPSGKVLAMLQAVLISSVATVAFGLNIQIYYGPITSGVAAPAVGAAIPANATAVGPATVFEAPTALGTAADLMAPIDITALAVGLNPGSQYWFDLAVKQVGGSGYSITNLGVILIEIG